MSASEIAASAANNTGRTITQVAPFAAASSRGPSPFVRRRIGRALLAFVLTVAGLLMISPIVWVVIESFETPTDQFHIPPVWIPSHVTLASYRTLFDAAPFVDNLLNSLVVTAAVIIGSAVVSILAAYAFARFEFPGRELLFIIFLAALTLPSQVSAVPEFVVIKYLHLLNSQASLVIPALIQVIGIFLLRQHFRTIPEELFDAAQVDGAGHLTILRRVVVPMSWPAISAVVVITGQYIWNDFFWPLLFISDQKRMTAPLALYNAQQTSGGEIGAVFAGLTILSIPVVLAFLFMQRRLMEGIGYAGISR
jgi:multiple sugar transport system permease protein